MFNVYRAKLRQSVTGTRSVSMGLRSNPFSVTQSIRDTASVFDRPHLLSFDAFGTLYTPKAPVAEQYRDIAKEYGVERDAKDIAARFPEVHKEMIRQFPNYGKDSPYIATSYDWWKIFIGQLLNIDIHQKQELCERLIYHFTGPDGYVVYEDVEPTLQELQNHGIKMVVSSNSDPRVHKIVSSLGLGKYFSNVVASYDIGVEKPDKRFFDRVLSSVGEGKENLERIWHIGDSTDKDFIGSIRAGWNGVLVDRTKSSGYFGPKPPLQDLYPGCSIGKVPSTNNGTPDILTIANNRVAISSLYKLLDLYDFQRKEKYTGQHVGI